MKGEKAEKKWSKDELEAAVKKAVRARAPDFKAKASTLTFEGARRMIEKDLRMKQFSLDAYKKYFKRCMEECISTDDGEETPDPSQCTESKAEKSTVEEPVETQNTSELKNNGASNFDEALASDTEIRNDISKDMIREAIKERALFFKENLETLSLMRVRRLLEEDLKLSTKALDVHKAFISTELDKALASLEMNKSENGAQKKPKKGSQKVEKSQASEGSKITHEESSLSDNASKDSKHSKVEKKRKRAVSKVKASTKNSASQKNSVDKKKSIASSKSKKVAKNERGNYSDEEREAGNSSDKNESRSSDEEEDAKKRREKPTPQVYGRKVDHLKGIIKSCGLGIPPAVYRRAKQAPEDKREVCLIKELEEILEKEGLSTNPSEKEIKEVKKRKERAKELEGIDMSNIITSSRRRGSAFSYIPPPKPPKIELSSDDDDDDDDEDDDDDDDDVELEKGDVNDDNEDGDGDGDGGDQGGDEGNNDGNQGGDKGNGDGDTNDRGDHRGGEGNDNEGDEGKGSGQDGADDSH